MSGPVEGGNQGATGQPGQKTGSMMGGMLAGLSRADRLMVGGALLALVGGDWIFGVLLGGGGLESWVLVATSELLLAVWIRNRRPNVSWVVSYGFVVSALVVSVATTEFSDFLFATAGGGLANADAETLLANLCAWGGGAIMAGGVADHWMSGGG